MTAKDVIEWTAIVFDQIEKEERLRCLTLIREAADVADSQGQTRASNVLGVVAKHVAKSGQ